MRNQMGFGSNLLEREGTKFGIRKDHQHKFKITGLSPGSKYYYRVAAGQDTYTGSFRAAPSSNATSAEFLAYGDTRSNPDKQNQVCGNIISAWPKTRIVRPLSCMSATGLNGNSEKHWANEFFNREYKNNITMQANLPIAGLQGKSRRQRNRQIIYRILAISVCRQRPILVVRLRARHMWQLLMNIQITAEVLPSLNGLNRI